MGNLMTFNPAFDWTAKHIDRNAALSMLNEALSSATEFKDNLFYHPNLFAAGEPSLQLFMDLWLSDFNAFKVIYPWIKEPQYQVLVNLRNYFKSSPPNSTSLQGLSNNTGILNNAWIGIVTECPEYLVYNYSTWEQFHCNYVSTFSRMQRQQNLEYFLKFYRPELKVESNQINSLIKQNRVHPLFDRVDTPKTDALGKILHGEKPQIHFKDERESALNIDGIWKHEGFDLPNPVCEQLIEWGFILPENII